MRLASAGKVYWLVYYALGSVYMAERHTTLPIVSENMNRHWLQRDTCRDVVCIFIKYAFFFHTYAILAYKVHSSNSATYIQNHAVAIHIHVCSFMYWYVYWYNLFLKFYLQSKGLAQGVFKSSGSVPSPDTSLGKHRTDPHSTIYRAT